MPLSLIDGPSERMRDDLGRSAIVRKTGRLLLHAEEGPSRKTLFHAREVGDAETDILQGFTVSG